MQIVNYISNKKLNYKKKKLNFLVLNDKKNIYINIYLLNWVQSKFNKYLLYLIFIYFFSSGSIDANNALIIKGRFQQKQIESVLRSYISKINSKNYFFYFCIFF